jgi:uncharacterized protein (DUF1330 family)
MSILFFLVSEKGVFIMPAYVISEVELQDENAAKSYMKFAEASIAEYDGRYLVRGATAEVIEGKPTKRKIVIVEFPSMERARKWYTSPAYAKALQFREKALDRQLTFVDGVLPFAEKTEMRK